MTSMTLIDRSVVEQAMEALKYERDANNPLDWHHDKTMTALRAALEQPQDHPEQRLNMVPAGWKLVPVEATDSQIRAAQATWWHACNCETYWDQIYAAMIAAAPQPPVVEHPQGGQKPETWQPIETAPKGRIVLVHYKNRLGNGRTMRARYYLEDTLDSDTTESGWADEGWYEESEAYEYLMPLDGDPTHWMPLPPPPGSAQDASNISAEEDTADDNKDSHAPMPEEVIRSMCKQPWLFETVRQRVRITERYHNIGTFVQSGESSGD